MKGPIAQINLAPANGYKGQGPLGLESIFDPNMAPMVFQKFLSAVVGIMTVIAIIWFTFIFITGAIGIINSGGDKAGLENAKKRITNGLIGLLVVILSIFLIDLIGYLLGIDILNIDDFIYNLGRYISS